MPENLSIQPDTQAVLPAGMDAPIGIFKAKMDDDLTILAGNDTYYQLIGYTREQMCDELGCQAIRYMHPDNRETVCALIKTALDAGESSIHFEMKILRRDGACVWMLVHGVFEQTAAGMLMCGYILDCTDRKQAEARSRINEERYRIAISLTGNCIWEFDFATRSIYQKDGSLSKYTVYDAVVPNVPASLIESGVIHPDYAEDLIAMYDRLLAGAGTTEWIGKARREGAGYAWTKITYATIFDEYGHPIRAVGISEDLDQKRKDDLTVRKKIEAAQAYRWDELPPLGPDKTWMFDMAEEIVYISDPVTHEMLYINEAGRKASASNQMVGRKCHQVILGLDKPCPFCPIPFLKEESWYVWEQDNPLLSRRYHMRDKLVTWNGRPAHIQLSVDITDQQFLMRRLTDKTDTVNILLQCIDCLVHTNRLDSAVYAMLRLIGDFYGAQRAYILEQPGDGRSPDIRVAHLWTREEGDGAIVSSLPAAVRERWIKAFSRRETIFLTNPETQRIAHPEEYAYWKEMRIRSFYLMPFEGETDAVRYFGIDNPTLHTEHISLLSSLSFFVANELTKRRMREQQEFAVFHDLLTGLLNRNSYLQYLKQTDMAGLSSMGVAMANLNGLKSINQSCGHVYGNELIIQTARLLTDRFPDGQVYRFSGDEFVILCENIARDPFIERIQDVRRQANSMLNGGFSLGYVWTDVDIDPEQLIEHACERMQVAKREYYENAEAISRNSRPSMIHRLQEELSSGRFKMYLQAKVDSRTKTIVGAEALVRYSSERGELIPPARFIPALEKEKIICYVDLFIFEEVCKTLQRWQRLGAAPLPVSLNFSRATMLEHDLLDKLLAICGKYGVDPALLEIEITESIGDIERETLASIGVKIAEHGFQLSLDDFGSKFSSMSILSVLKFNVVKLDRSLVNDLVQNDSSRTVIQHMIEMCTALGIANVAEGVETLEQFRILQEMGCGAIQGYLFSKPLPLREFEAFAGRIPAEQNVSIT